MEKNSVVLRFAEIVFGALFERHIEVINRTAMKNQNEK